MPVEPAAPSPGYMPLPLTSVYILLDAWPGALRRMRSYGTTAPDLLGAPYDEQVR